MPIRFAPRVSVTARHRVVPLHRALDGQSLRRRERDGRLPPFAHELHLRHRRRDLACERLSTVECFARYRHGYCQHYATTMAILLREHGIPTRLVAGFLPGQRDAGVFETVRFSAAHAWVEAYFPDYGWVEFDPTGGGVASTEPLPTGEPVS